MRAAVTHINLLENAQPRHWLAWALVVLMALSMIGSAGYGLALRSAASAAEHQRDDVAEQVKQVQSRIAALSGQQAKTAGALALRDEVNALQPQVQAARALTTAVGGAQGGRSEDLSRTLDVVGAVNEPGLWLTALNVTAGGKRLELQGEAHNAATVLRYAQRANLALKPLALRLDTLEVQPAAVHDGAVPAASSGAVSFRLN